MMNSELSMKGNAEPLINSQQPAFVRFFAHLFSLIFHPLFIPLYVSWFIEFVHPSYFSGFSDAGKLRVLLSIFRFLFY